MKDYTNKTPVFSESIRVTEVSDPAHADNINAAPKQLLQNTLSNRNFILELSGIICSYAYCADVETISCIVPHGYADETLQFPTVLAYMDGETVVLVSGTGALGSIQSGGDGSPYVLPIATADTLGGVKIGSGIKRQADGTISVDTDGVAESVSGQVAASAAEKAAEIVERNATEPSDDAIDRLFDTESI